MRAGRPLKFTTVEDLEVKIADYFASCWEEVWQQKLMPGQHKVAIIDRKMEWVQVFDRVGNPVLRQIRPYTITGLAVALDTSRRTLLDYEEKTEYTHAIKKAKDICEQFLEEGMIKGTINAIPGIFNAKNNYGWKDKHEVGIEGNLVTMPGVVINGKELKVDIGDQSAGDSKDPGEADPDSIGD